MDGGTYFGELGGMATLRFLRRAGDVLSGRLMSWDVVVVVTAAALGRTKGELFRTHDFLLVSLGPFVVIVVVAESPAWGKLEVGRG